jgi:hypothetical protein
MGRWRYLNLAVLLAVGFFLYQGLFTVRSPLAPKPMGAVVHPMQPIGPCRGQVGHAVHLRSGERVGLQVRLSPGCSQQLLDAGVAIAADRPGSLAEDGVGIVRGTANRLSAGLSVPSAACAADARIWLGVRAPGDEPAWTSWPLEGSATKVDGC